MLNEIIHIVTDPAHWAGEIVMDGTIATVVWFVGGRFALRKHDREVHHRYH